jgi:hypoxanthine phosphoribosyltransferase
VSIRRSTSSVRGSPLAPAKDYDVADTGETLKLVVDLLNPAVAEVRSAVLYRKARSILAPDYCWRSTEAWINFPWSTEPPVR